MSDLVPSERAKRSSVIIRADIRPADGRAVTRRVRNLSLTGACVDHEGELAVGQRLMLDMGRLDAIEAEVVWVKDRLAGIHFEEPIDLDAARAARGVGRVETGWMTNIHHAYRKRG
ncbi:hypothetical protein GCM10011380_11350 [Sphingomonas metalli]|uniref:PilZ domain-containing protein n=1 Tax=Sphingomonas metalli TaxID=1779358 RepID=A0A916SYT8_9SPHN|nr:PilZ domain-containing protein [Sphingomonas metalli]GGB23358.1 hypothetical protein GCM10011380_11350 [Sphingomonas metalli]